MSRDKYMVSIQIFPQVSELYPNILKQNVLSRLTLRMTKIARQLVRAMVNEMAVYNYISELIFRFYNTKKYQCLHFFRLQKVATSSSYLLHNSRSWTTIIFGCSRFSCLLGFIRRRFCISQSSQCTEVQDMYLEHSDWISKIPNYQDLPKQSQWCNGAIANSY